MSRALLIRRLLFVVALACTLNGAWADQVVQDDRQMAVRLPASPQRIVSMLPSLTEMMCDMGACARLVGTDQYSDFPASVRALPKLGGLDDANVEGIVALKPDVVLLATSSRASERLERLGLRVVALEPHTYEDVRRVASKVAQIIGQPEAGERLWLRMEKQVQAAVQIVPPAARGLSVYYEVDSAPFAAGESSFIGASLKRLGVVNIVPAALGPFPKLNPEYVVRQNPAVIMVSEGHAQALSRRPGWDRIRAVRERKVCAFTPAQSDVLSRPGPRMGEAALIMAGCLRQLTLASGSTR